jgi:hypothetical protein
MRQLRASGIARRRTEPGWRAAVLNERASRHAFRLRSERGRQRLPSASLSERSEQYARSERRHSFLCPIARYRSLQIAPGKPPTLSSLADEKRVSSLLRSTAARDPVRATTTAADPKRDARAALKKCAPN